MRAKVEAAESATRWLSVRIDQLARQARDAEVKVERYKAEHNLAEGPDGTPLIDQQILAISTQLVQARADLAQRQGEAGRGSSASQVAASPLIVQLRQQEAQLIQQKADMATRYGPRHPKMQEMQSQIRELNAKIGEETRRITGGMRNDVAATAAQVASLEASLARAQKDASAQSMTRVELKALEANAQSTRTMYQSFVTRLRQVQDEEAIQMPDARVVSRASPPSSPSSPKRTLIFAAAVPAGLLLGLLVALFMERLGAALPMPTARPDIARALPKARKPEPMSVALAPKPALQPAPPPPVGATPQGLPVLAEFPDLIKMSAADEAPADYVVDHPASGFARAVAALDRQIATKNSQAPKVLVVTGSELGSTKTTIALSLARAASRRGQHVILIDGDPKEPSAGPMMRLPSPTGGHRRSRHRRDAAVEKRGAGFAVERHAAVVGAQAVEGARADRLAPHAPTDGVSAREVRSGDRGRTACACHRRHSIHSVCRCRAGRCRGKRAPATGRHAHLGRACHHRRADHRRGAGQLGLGEVPQAPPL